MGRGQAARRGTLDPVFGGSNPPAPTSLVSEATDGVRAEALHRQREPGAGRGDRAVPPRAAGATPRSSRFSDGEVFVQVNENVRGADVFVIQPTCPPVNDTLMELLIMIDALKRASAHRITAVLPYYGYARQDRKVQPRVPITAKLVADLLEAAGVDRVLALDLHAGQIQGFFNIPVDHLFAGPVVMIDYLAQEGPAGSGDRVARRRRRGARARHRQAAQRRPRHHRQAPRGPQLGGRHAPHRRRRRPRRRRHRRHDRHRRHARAGGRAPSQREGARRILACGVHAVLSGPAIERIKASPIEEVVVTNSIPLAADKRAAARITVLSVAPLLGRGDPAHPRRGIRLDPVRLDGRSFRHADARADDQAPRGHRQAARQAAAPRRASSRRSSTAAPRPSRSPSIPRRCSG